MRLYYAPGACSLGIHVLLEGTSPDFFQPFVRQLVPPSYSLAFAGLVFFRPEQMLLILVFGLMLGLGGSLVSVGRHLRQYTGWSLR